ncbi:asparagine--tRNA ligase [Acidobacteria bacterium ACD]|nr:MAG: asparagine--tRNA ligase [Acidobacteriota bacterium]MDL1949361.1 asparagine--tRNA ligase [Acidobacteria bacterium ACD]
MSATPASAPSISELPSRVGQTVTLKGWLYNKRESGKIRFLVLRDGSGYLQAVVVKKEVPEEVWEASGAATQESTLEVTGVVRSDPRQAGGVELGVAGLRVLDLCHDWPITPKEHGVDFLMSQRHLWLRSAKQVAILRVRSEVESAIHDFYHSRGYVRVDSPILTPTACEGTSTLFETQYTDEEKAYLSQSGQLYVEPAAAALGKVYCFGPTFRAEKSKTRRHLREFWMVEPEVAFLEIDGLLDLAEEFVRELTVRVLDRRKEDLARLERDTRVLEATATKPFARIEYRQAIEILKGKGFPVSFGDDLGGDEETALTEGFDTPVLVTRYPAKIKAFYMQPADDDPEVASCLDMLAPEGYGEIIGGSQRIHDHDLLLRRIHEHGLPVEPLQWYLDIRKYGTFPHSGFGMGLERFTAWMCGVPHLRECIPYPRMLYRIYP